MKKYGVENLAKNAKILSKKNKGKKIKIKAKLIAGAAAKKPPLSSYLASINVNAESVINAFNAQTMNKYAQDTLLKTLIYIDNKKNFIIVPKLPAIYETFEKIGLHKYNDNLYDEELKLKEKLSYLTYKLSIARAHSNRLNKKYLLPDMKQMYGSITSWDIYTLADHKKDKKRGKKKNKW